MGSIFRPRKVPFFFREVGNGDFLRVGPLKGGNGGDVSCWKICAVGWHAPIANFSTKDCWAEDFQEWKTVVDAGGQHGAQTLWFSYTPPKTAS